MECIDSSLMLLSRKAGKADPLVVGLKIHSIGCEMDENFLGIHHVRLWTKCGKIWESCILE